MKKPLTPGQKQSGLEDMQDEYSGCSIETHEPFILNTLLPLITAQAQKTEHPASVVVLACFMSLATILQAKGLSRNKLIALVDGSRLEMHDAPEGLH
ncbi:hypothetical protein [Pseudomonas luteola]|uniref:hypothetical protein n=1 Tax=Pseudomonas luteola TaxID=47886 RepID=UPI002899039E|nr:hypothetical protein [Pseudomonas luteola]